MLRRWWEGLCTLVFMMMSLLLAQPLVGLSRHSSWQPTSELKSTTGAASGEIGTAATRRSETEESTRDAARPGALFARSSMAAVGSIVTTSSSMWAIPSSLIARERHCTAVLAVFFEESLRDDNAF